MMSRLEKAAQRKTAAADSKIKDPTLELPFQKCLSG